MQKIHKTKYSLWLSLLAVLFLAQCNSPSKKAETSPPPSALPMKVISLESLEEFQPVGKNWQIASDALAGIEKGSPLVPVDGSGVLFNQPSGENKDNLFTKMEHGDIELEIEFLMPQGSNSGIYFQGRYEIQLFDSWNVESPKHSDCGGIYQRWDESRAEGEKGYEGHPPSVNASMAPGLWQKYRISFRAPRFDEAGNKTENARFEYVYHNGFLIHENVEVTGPTRAAAYNDEKPLGPIMIQGDHGPVAIRNIRYKNYTQESLSLTDINYEMFDGNWTTMPDLKGLEVIKKGTSEILDPSPNPDKNDKYALQYTGILHVPVEGDYLFETQIDDGGELFIDDQLVVFNDGDPGYGAERGLITLTKGEHPFRMTYFQDVWGATLRVFYEGPGIKRKQLAGEERKSVSSAEPQPLMIDRLQAPEMVRSFINYGNGPKKTHAISVGDPVDVHYSYNLANGALLKVWRGTFANVTEMWRNRGEPQLLKPGNAAIETIDGPQVAFLENPEGQWPDTLQKEFSFKGYDINENDRPVFIYHYKDISFADLIKPTEDGLFLKRTITATTQNPSSNIWFRVAMADHIDALGDGTYRIGGKHYLALKNNENAIIRDGKELIVPIASNGNVSTIEYTLIW